MTPYYTDDRATLYRCDALALMPQIPDDTVDAVLTDAPYSSGGMYRGDRMADVHTKYTGGSRSAPSVAAFSGDNRDQRGYAYWSTLWLLEALRLTRPGGVVMLWTDWRQLPTTTDVLQAGGWVYRGIIPWVKPDGRPQVGRFTSACEYVVWGSKGPMPANREIGCLPGFYQARAPRGADKIDLTEQRLSVLREVMRIVPPGGLVFDPFAGSGGTGVAALIEGRRFVGAEITEHYAAVAAERLRTSALQPSSRDQGDLLVGLGAERAA
jgi:site-specific DNA-methyltransferase (adenine-specific)